MRSVEQWNNGLRPGVSGDQYSQSYAEVCKRDRYLQTEELVACRRDGERGQRTAPWR